MNRNILFASWAAVAVAGTLWACSSTITAHDLGPVDGGGSGDDASLGGDGAGGDDSGGSSDSARKGDSAEAGGESACGATSTFRDCAVCCAGFHPTGVSVIPRAAHACACLKGVGLITHECATPCKLNYCNDAGATSPEAGSPCDVCLNKAFAGDAGDAAAPQSSRPGDCLGPAISACTDDPECVAYENCKFTAACDSKP